MLKKRKIIYALISISLLLIISNIFLEKYFDDDKEVTPEVFQNSIEEKFLQSLENYGIIHDWISSSKPKQHETDSIKYIYKIKVPSDISIALVIKEISSAFIGQPVIVESFEEKNFSNSEIKIYSNSILKLNAKLVHDRNIKREYAEYGFIVKIDERIESETVEKLSRLYYDFYTAYIPSVFSKDIMDKISCKYVVLLNDEIEDNQFLLEEDFTKQRLVNGIKEIIITYGRNSFYLIDENSKIYNSKIYSLIKEEFEKRGIKIFTLNSITPLSAETEKQLHSLFQFYSTSMKGKGGKNFFIKCDDLISLNPLIERQLKMGDRVKLPNFDSLLK